MEKEKKKKSKLKIGLLFLMLLIIGTLLWSRYISTTGLVVREYAVNNEKIPKSFNGFKIIQFSDLHYGRTVDENYLEKVIEEINQLNPDIVFFTGDLIDKDINVTEKTQTTISSYLNKINSNIGKYAIKGNHDYYNDVPYKTIMENGGFTLIDNTSKYIYFNSNIPIILTGLPSSLQDFPDYESAITTLGTSTEDYAKLFKLVIMHEPDIIKELSDYDLDLVLAGHSHNGQIRIPYFGAVVKSIGSKTYFDSYYKVNDTDLYISGGIGVSQYNFRFLNKPSISLYRLYNN